MIFIAVHWQDIATVVTLAFVGVILIVHGVREYRLRQVMGTDYAGRDRSIHSPEKRP